MKKSYLFLFLLFTTLIQVMHLPNQRKLDPSPAVETLRTAMISADSSVLDALTHPALFYGHFSGRVEDKASFITSLTSGASDFVTIDLRDQIVQIVDRTALVRHLLLANTNDNGKPGSVKLSILTIWEKEKGRWKLLGRQAVRI